MKKLISFLLTLCLLIPAVAIGAEQPLKFGTLNKLEEEDMSFSAGNQNLPLIKAGGVRIDYDSLAEMELALSNGEVDILSTPNFVAQYLNAKDPRFLYVPRENVTFHFVMGVLPEKTDLLAQLNEGIAKLKKDGTLEALRAQWELPEAVLMPATAPVEGAQTVRIALTGDLPPMDYIAADGTAAGFNVAFTRALGELYGWDVEFVFVETNERVTALNSGKVDVVFSLQGYADHSNPANNQYAMTECYLEDSGSRISMDQALLTK